MQEEVRKDILSILKDSLVCIGENNILKLKELSNHTLHNATIYQDEYSTSIAVLIYSLSKIFERTRYTEYRTWPIFQKKVLETIKKSIDFLEKNNTESYDLAIQNLLLTIDKLEHKLSLHIKEVIEKAKINKASRIHEHGISIEKTASLLGISEWELMDYVGGTGIADVKFAVTKDALTRLKFARGLFR